MTATSSGKKSKPARMLKTGTSSKKRHRFESFKQRVAKLNIDPIHKTRQSDRDLDDDDPAASYFKNDLEKWRELNLSENFASFVREVSPLCNTLPQVLHYQKDIAKILASHIREGDVLSLEPLLSLLACFAHDLAAKFEVHFSDAIALVTSLATKHADIEVIEWSFNCLAWLFKYLSRLLVPDLRPLLRIMTPLLGREPQKLFTTRFAAESLSFLLRKAALVYHKNQKPLQNAIGYILDDIDRQYQQGKETQLYNYGLTILMVDAIKGIDRGLHSSGTTLYGFLVDSILSRTGEGRGRARLLEGVTVGLIHLTDASTFRPLLDHFLSSCQQQIKQKADVQCSGHAVQACERLLCVMATVRKGSRIQEWDPLLDTLLKLLRLREEHEERPTEVVFEAAAVMMQSAPLDLLLPRIRPVMDRVANNQNEDRFLVFCEVFCKLSNERFNSLIHPYLVKFLNHRWQNQRRQLCLTLPKVVEGSTKGKLSCPVSWQKDIVACFELAETSGEVALIADCYNYVKAFEQMAVSTPTKGAVMKSLRALILQSLRSLSLINSKSIFSFGEGLKAYAEYQRTLGSGGTNIWQIALVAAEHYKTLPSFLEGLLTSLRTEDSLPEASLDGFIDQMIENLHCSSPVLRGLSLQIIDVAYAKTFGSEAGILNTAMAIEKMPLDLNSARTTSMYVRRLASQYQEDDLHPWLRKAIVNFCFGIQTFKLSSIWGDAIEVLKRICETSQGEEMVSDLAFRFLERPKRQEESAETAAEQAQRRSLDEFECSNLNEMDAAFDDCLTRLARPEEESIRLFSNNHIMTHGNVANAPAIALRVLFGIPRIAEKKSRGLVPIFLRWAAIEESEDPLSEQLLASCDDVGSFEVPKLSGQDRKTMLQLFGLFSNPRVLYRSGDVFNALCKLLANGDTELQKAALKAIFKWKIEALQAYQESLLNLLDEARFRDEVTVFLHGDEQNRRIQDEHRPQLMPILLRLLYGKLISRTGNQIAKRTQSVKRKIILEALSRLEDKEIQEFLNVAFGSLEQSLNPDDGRHASNQLSPRKQVGMLHLVKDMLTTLGTRLKPFTATLAVVVIGPTTQACHMLETEKSEADDREGSQTSLLKSIRQMGLQCVSLLFQHCTILQIRPHLPLLFVEAIDPRIPSLPIETAQSVSGLLQLFSTWASSSQTALVLIEYNPTLLACLASCLEVPFAKDEVKTFVLESILKPLVALAEPEHTHSHDELQLQIVERVLRPNIDALLTHLGGLLRKSPPKELLASAIDGVTRLASFVQGSSQIKNIVALASFLLTQPSQRVSPRTKGDLLQILHHLMPQHDFAETPELQELLFTTISSLFGYFRDRNNRVTLVEVLSALAQKDQELQKVAAFCRSLNSYSQTKIDEPDFDDRLRAFSIINEHEFHRLTKKEWRPILYNMLFFIRDKEELAVRSSASFALRRFVEANRVDPVDNDDSTSSDMTKNVLLPALRKGVSEASELVRIEYLAVIAHLVRLNPGWAEVSDMSVLLVAEDEEASFFSNVLHIQRHRRLRALRRLAAEARHNRLHSNNVAHFFLPLIEHFVFDKADDEGAHNLSAETITTVGALALSLEWPQFRAVFRRYLGYIESKPDLEKTMIKLIGVLADKLGAATETEAEKALSSTAQSELQEEPTAVSQGSCMLVRTLPKTERLVGDVTKNMLPSLTKYLHEKDESTVSLRVPVAVSAVKLLKMLPPSHIENRLPAILTDVCNILRSRAQESRDLTRKTLVDIAIVAGPAYFGFILKELRIALARGYQLHVLSYTVHAILVGAGSVYQFGDLDYCLPQIVAVIMDDIFGATGQEKDAEEYISKMKEVKSSKSHDSMEIVARSATAESFLHLIRPVQSLLNERLDLKTVRKIDELLRRIGLGLLHNEKIQSRQVLVFCHEVIREVYQTAEEGEERVSAQDRRNKRFLVRITGAQKSHRGSTSSFRYKLARFAFDLLRSVLHRYDSLQTPANLAGFMPMLGDALVQSNEETRMSAIRLLTAIIKVPLREIDSNAALYVTEAVKVVKASPSTNTELAQASLKLVSAILRERRDVEVRETDLAYLLKRIQPDLEELDRQGVAFNLLKAVMTRRIVIVEVYEVLETIASMMITNHTRGSRDQARSVYFDFLIHYPQGKGRFAKQLSFLAKNLDYKHPEGRQSVMEAIHLLLSKLSEDLLQAVLETFFVPLVMVLVNDESLPCREMAGALLKTILERADSERKEAFTTLLRSWLPQSKQPLLVRVALQVYTIYLETQATPAEKELPFLFGQLTRILKANNREHDEVDWEQLYYALQTFAKACQTFPTASFAANTTIIWICVRECLLFPHLWVKTSAAKLQGLLFADFARTNVAYDKPPEMPLRGSGGLHLSGMDMEQVTRASLALLKVPMLNEDLATQTVRNLIFLAKMMNNTSWIWGSTVANGPHVQEEQQADESEDEASDAEEDRSHSRSGLQFIMRRASAILRRGPLTSREASLIPVKAALQLIGALCGNLPIEAITPSIETVLLPLQNLTDPAIPPPFSNDEAFVAGYRALVSHGSEIMAALQKKLGTTEYVARLSKVREGIRERREGRRVKRRIEAVAEPEKMGRMKARKGEKKKEKRKEKSAGQRSRRRGW
ncbi:MAG: hypothetical protein LQ348_004184 [Seirophora lacunosa]|nr:MAG: hypothetical protein LQ348_004184 [Seirophora lacunosa]